MKICYCYADAEYYDTCYCSCSKSKEPYMIYTGDDCQEWAHRSLSVVIDSVKNLANEEYEMLNTLKNYFLTKNREKYPDRKTRWALNNEQETLMEVLCNYFIENYKRTTKRYYLKSEQEYILNMLQFFFDEHKGWFSSNEENEILNELQEFFDDMIKRFKQFRRFLKNDMLEKVISKNQMEKT